MIAATFFPSSIPVLDAARYAAAMGCGLYITRRGQTVIAPQARPGWQRIGVVLKPSVRDPYEATDATAACCDIGRAA